MTDHRANCKCTCHQESGAIGAKLVPAGQEEVQKQENLLSGQVGNVPATKKVVQLGPNWFQKEEKKYMNWKILMPVVLPVRVPHRQAGRRNRMKHAKNPVACSTCTN